MNRNIDTLGRLVIPKEMRTQLDIKENDLLNIELQDNKIIITKHDAVDYKGIVEEAKEYIENKLLYVELYGEQEFSVNDLLDILNNILNKGL